MTHPWDPKEESPKAPVKETGQSATVVSDGESASTPDAQRHRLDVRDLKTYFFLDEGILKAVDNLDLHIKDDETIGVIGESGSGKSVMARSLMRLVTRPGEIVGGQGILRRKNGQTVDLFGLAPDSALLRDIRGNDIAMVFQEPMTAFSPVYTIGHQIAEMVKIHRKISEKDLKPYVVELLRKVGISNPGQRVDEYPHQLSGGMRQRAIIAMALSCDPYILLADEPTTALDVTIQAQILTLLKDLQKSEHMSVMYITHDLAVVAETVDRVYVMYLGRVMEMTTTRELFANPLHPYTQKLMNAIPKPGERVERLEVIEGNVPTPLDPPIQCPFFSRCDKRMPGICDVAIPELVENTPGHSVRCFLYSQETEPEDEWSRI